MKFANLVVACLLLVGVGSAGAQDSYPSKRINVLVPYAPGGPTDTLARVVAEKLRVAFNQPIIVDNVAGATGTIAMARVAREPADGHTMFLGSGGNFIAALMMKVDYDALKDLVPVATLATIPLALQIHPSVPAKNVAEFIAYAKANPGKLNAYTTGVGSLNEVALELFNATAGVQITAVPYKGQALAMQDLLGGRVQLAFDALIGSQAYETAGRLKLLAVTSKSRVSMAPQLPTLIEAGMPNFEVVSWLSVFMRAGTSSPMLRTMTDALRNAMTQPDIQQRFATAGYVVNFENGQEMGARLMEDVAKWRKIIKEIDMKLQ